MKKFNNLKKVNIFFSNINVVNIFIGYPFITSIFIPLFGNSVETTGIVTIPYRAISLMIAVLVIFLNIKKRTNLSLPLKLFFIFWVLLLFRIYSDLELSGYIIPGVYKQKIYLFAIALTFIPMFSLVKSINKIDFPLCLKYIFILGNCILVLAFFSAVQGASLDQRIDENIALNTISFGLVAITIVIIAIYLLVTEKNNSLLTKIFYSFSIILGLYDALRAGSRGPILSLLIVLIFWYSFKEKKISFAVYKFALLIFFTLLIKPFLFKLIGAISPLMVLRIRDAADGTDFSVLARQKSYLWFLEAILKSPILGSHFAQMNDGRFPMYAHNIFLDILLGFGVLGLGLFLYIIIKVIKNIRANIIEKNFFWIGLIVIQSLVLSLTSGSYYSDPVLNCSIVLSLLIYKKNNQKLRPRYESIE